MFRGSVVFTATMNAKAVLWLLFSTTLLQFNEVFSRKECIGFGFSRKIGRRLLCGVFKTLTAEHIQCQKICVKTEHCFAINFCEKESGSKICELIKRTEDAEEQKGCIIGNSECEYNELTEVHDCVGNTKECLPKAAPKKDGWHKRGHVSFKLFSDKRTWHEAVKACKEKGAVIAKIRSKADNDFVSENVMPSVRPGKQAKRFLPASLRPLQHWKLDGTDSGLRLFGESKFEKDVDGFTKVLYLPGTNWSFAETPAPFNLNQSNFTVSLWVRSAVEDALVYGRWGTPDYFGLGITNKTFLVIFKSKANEEKRFDFRIPAFLNRWVHYTAVLDRTNSNITLYINGKKLYTKRDPWLRNYLASIPPPPTMDIGVVRSEEGYHVMRGTISHLILFNKALEDKEVTLVRDSFYMGNSAWIGLNDITTEGRYMMDDSQVASYLNFAPEQIAEDVQDCVSMRAWDEGRMDVNHCNYTVLPYICMKRLR